MPAIHAYFLGLLSRALLPLGRIDEALLAAEQGEALLASQGGLEEGEVIIRLARAEALHASGRVDEARLAVRAVRDAVVLRASKIGNDEWQRSYLDRVEENRRALQLVVEWGAEGPEDSESKTLARGLADSVAVIAGSGVTLPIAYRWKTQINEHAKLPAFAHELPELDHNEICGWNGAPGLGRFSAVFLEDADLHPRVLERVELTQRLIGDQAQATFRVGTVSEGPVERVMSLVLLGDLVALYLAVLRGVDPTPVDIIGELKGELAARS